MAETLRVRANSVAENFAVLRELQTRKEVQDQRTKDELDALFRRVNAECTRRSAKLNFEKIQKPAHYGLIPGIQSGKWWGIRMDCSRDCIHEPLNENVHRGPIGAISICTSHLNTNNDVDLGNILTFTGQEYSAIDKSKDSLILSHKNKVPIRLVRSYCLSNDYAPKTGCRYDGLYTVIYHWLGVRADNTKLHKFVLVRVLNQDNPVWLEKIARFSNITSKNSLSPRLTRSFKKISSKKSRAPKFVYNKIEEEPNINTVSAIVSRQVFAKNITEFPESSPKSISSPDSANFCLISCAKKSCNTNLSIRTNLYNSSTQDTKKTPSFTFKSTSYLKSNQCVQYLRKNQLESEKIGTDTSDTEGTDKIVNLSSADEFLEKKVKQVTWSDSRDSPLDSTVKSFPKIINGYKYNKSKVFDQRKTQNRTIKGNSSPLEQSLSPIPNMKTFQHVAQIHAVSTPPPKVNTIATMRETRRENSDKSSDEESMSIDSLAPDKLVNIIVKEKYHPMAKLLIGNMIGLENGESEILGAYNTLISKINKDDSKVPCKENKLRNKFYIRNKTRKNGILKKQRREIANLMIDAKFEPVTRGSRRSRLRSPKKRPISKSELSQRKLVNGRRIPSRNINKDMRSSKDIRNTNVNVQSPKVEKTKKKDTVPTMKRPKMINSGVQCMLLTPPSVNEAVQFNSDTCCGSSTYASRVKTEPRSVDDEALISHKTVYDPESRTPQKKYFRVGGSAFVAVKMIDSIFRIDRLRSIGFKPIRSTPVIDEDSNQSNQVYEKPEVDEEYNKYASEETDEVAYLDEELHFEDIEDEISVKNAKKVCNDKQKNDFIKFPPPPVECLLEKDFDKPWHGWKKICANGQSYWIGY